MRPAQTPNGVLAASVLGLEGVLRAERPDWVLAQGDTTTVMATAIAAFHERVRQGFLTLANEDPARLRVIDTTRPRSDVHGARNGRAKTSGSAITSAANA